MRPPSTAVGSVSPLDLSGSTPVASAEFYFAAEGGLDAEDEYGNVYVVWEEYTGTYFEVWMNAYCQQAAGTYCTGKTPGAWGTATQLDSSYYTTYYPGAIDIAASPTGVVCVAWGITNADYVFFECYVSGAWTGVYDFTDDAEAVAPSIAFDEGGNLFMAVPDNNGAGDVCLVKVTVSSTPSGTCTEETEADLGIGYTYSLDSWAVSCLLTAATTCAVFYDDWTSSTAEGIEVAESANEFSTAGSFTYGPASISSETTSSSYGGGYFAPKTVENIQNGGASCSTSTGDCAIAYAYDSGDTHPESFIVKYAYSTNGWASAAGWANGNSPTSSGGVSVLAVTIEGANSPIVAWNSSTTLYVTGSAALAPSSSSAWGTTLTESCSGSYVCEPGLAEVPTSSNFDIGNNIAWRVDLVFSSSSELYYAYFYGPALEEPTASTTPIDVSQPTNIAVSLYSAPPVAEGFTISGSGNSYYYWSGLPTGCSSIAASFTCNPTGAGTFIISVYAIDTAGFVSTTVTGPTITVYNDPTVSSPTANPSSGGIDVSQSTTWTGTITTSSGYPPGTYTWHWDQSSTAFGCDNGAATTWTTSTTGVATDTVSCTPTAASTYTLQYYVTDPLGCNSGTSGGCTAVYTSAVSFVVYNDPTISAPSPGSASVDLSQSVTWTETLTTSNGYPTGGASFTWYWQQSSTALGCDGGAATTWTTSANTVSATVSCTPSAIGTYTLQAYVTDPNNCNSGGGSCVAAYNAAVSFTIYNDPTISEPSPAPLSGKIDVSQQVVWTETITTTNGYPTGGASFTWHWEQSSTGLGCDASTTWTTTANTASTTVTCTPTAEGTFTLQAYVTDPNNCNSGGGNCVAAYNSAVSYTVYNDPTISAPSPSVASDDLSQSVTWTETLTTSNGYPTGGASFTWYWKQSSTALGCDGGAATTWSTNANTVSTTVSCTPTAAGSYTLQVYVTDPNSCSSGGTNCAAAYNSASFSVYNDPTISAPSPSSASADLSQSVTWTETLTTVSGYPTGGAVFTWNWQQSSTALGCDGGSATAWTTTANTASTTVSCTPSAIGTYTLKAYVTDPNGCSSGGASCASAYNAAVSFTVYNDPTISAPSSAPVSGGADVSQSVTWTETLTTANGYPTGGASFTWHWQQSSTSLGCDGGLATTWTTSANTVSTTVSCVPSAQGTFTLNAYLTDPNSCNSGGANCVAAYNSAVSFTVINDPTISAPSPNVASDDLSQSVTWTETLTTANGYPTGGVAFTWYWKQSSLSLGCDGGAATSWSVTANTVSTTVGCTPSAIGTYTLQAYVTDPNGCSSGGASCSAAYNAAVSFTVYNDPTISALTPSVPGVDLNQSVIFSVSVTTVSGYPTTSGTWTWNWQQSSTSLGCDASASWATTTTGVSSATMTCTPPAAGGPFTLSVYVTDPNGCSSGGLNCASAYTVSAELMVNKDPTVTFTPSSTQNNESGQTNNFTAIASLGTVPYSYQWLLNGTAVPGADKSLYAFDPLHAGTYLINVTLTDAAGWVVHTTAVTEIVVPGPEASLTATTLLVDVGMPVEFYGGVTNGLPAYTFDYLLNGTLVQSGASVDWNITPQGNGTYTVTLKVIDSKSAISTQTLVLIVHSKPGLDISPASPVIDLGQGITLLVSPVGGTGPFSYQWYLNGTLITGASGTSYHFIPAGSAKYTFNATAIDTFGLVARSVKVVLTVNADPVFSISAPSNTLDAGQNISVAATASAGTTPYTCRWLVNSTVVPGATSCTGFTFTPAAPGPAWTVQAELVDNVGVWANTSTLTFKVNGPLHVSAAIPVALADLNQSISFSGSVAGGTPGYTCQWFVNGAAQAGATSCASFTYLTASVGNLSVYLEATDKVSNVVNSTVVVVSVSADPVLKLTGTTPKVDVGEILNVTGTPSLGTPSYVCSWYLNGTFQYSGSCDFFVYTVTSAGTYIVNATLLDAVGYSMNSKAVTIQASVPPSIAITTANTTIDEKQPLVISATLTGGSTPETCQWYLNAVAISSATSCSSYTFVPGATGTFALYVAVTDSASPAESADSGKISVKVDPQLLVSLSSPVTTVDSGMAVNYTASASGGTGSYSYQWLVNGSAFPGATGTSFLYVPFGSGSYVISIDIKDQAANSVSAQSTLTVNPRPTVSVTPVGPLWVIPGQLVDLSSSVSGGTLPVVSYVWSINGIAQSPGNSSFSFTPSALGTYTIDVNITDYVGVSALSVNVVIHVVSMVVKLAPVTEAEVGVPTTLTSTESGGTSPFTYVWIVNGKVQAGATGSGFNWIPSAEGTAVIEVLVTDADNITGNSTISVQVVPAISVSTSIAKQTGDLGQTFNLTSAVSGGSGKFKYQWFENGTAIAGATSSTFKFDPNAPGKYSFELEVNDSLGGVGESTSLVITVSSDPTIALTSSVSSAKVGTQVTLTASARFGISPYTISWYLNGTEIPLTSGTNYSFTPSGAGIFEFTVKLTDAAGYTVKSNIVEVNVTAQSSHGPTGGSSGLSSLWLWILLIIAAVAVVLIVVMTRRRRTAEKEVTEGPQEPMAPSGKSLPEGALGPEPVQPPMEGLAIGASEVAWAAPAETQGEILPHPEEPMAAQPPGEGPAQPAEEAMPPVEPVPEVPPEAPADELQGARLEEIERALTEAQKRLEGTSDESARALEESLATTTAATQAPTREPARTCFVCGTELKGDYCTVCNMHWG